MSIVLVIVGQDGGTLLEGLKDDLRLDIHLLSTPELVENLLEGSGHGVLIVGVRYLRGKER